MTAPHSLFVAALARAIGARSYLELGIYEGETFALVEAVVPDCLGCDLHPRVASAARNIFQGSTEQFFRSYPHRTFDLIFIDADHSFRVVRADLMRSLDRLNVGGLIVIHDTDPARPELEQPGYCDDSHRLVDWIDTERPDLRAVTLPIGDPGLTIVQRRSDRRVLRWFP